MKATEIINAKCMGIVRTVGGFHLLISFLGSIGGLMKGSGLEEALAVVCINYAKRARLHLQNMLNLKSTHPWVYEKFTEGHLHTF